MLNAKTVETVCLLSKLYDTEKHSLQESGKNSYGGTENARLYVNEDVLTGLPEKDSEIDTEIYEIKIEQLKNTIQIAKKAIK